jgi:hypothetical protein
MAYCRFGADSDVYMFATAGENGATDFVFYYSFRGKLTKVIQVTGITEALKVFAKLKRKGYIFPEYATEKLHAELKGENVC